MTNYRDNHINRLIAVTNDLWKQPGSVCKKCHDVPGTLNCLLCWCPLYNTDCCGHYVMLPNGVKDCSECIIPHDPEFVRKYLNNAEL